MAWRWGTCQSLVFAVPSLQAGTPPPPPTPPPTAHSFHFLDSILSSTNVLIFIKSKLCIFSFCCLFWYPLRNHCLIPGVEDLHLFRSKSFIDLVLTVRTLDSFRAKFHRWYEAEVQIISFTCRSQMVPALIVQKTLLLFIEIAWHSCLKSIDHKC